MNRMQTIRPEFVEFIPSALENGILYVSDKYQTATHLCCCGCGNRVVTPLKPGGWKLTTKRGAVTLYPSIGSWSLPCQSHYWIRQSQVQWARQWTRAEIEVGRIRDQGDREAYFDAPRTKWQRVVRSAKVFLGRLRELP